jgi:peptide/nickel transport system permease protein
MGAYFVRRLLWAPVTIILVSIVCFLAVRFVPGNAIDLIQAEMSSVSTEPVDRAAIEHAMGLDVPVYVQYGRWVDNIVIHGSLGASLVGTDNITQEMVSSIPVTLELGILAVIIGIVISIPIGIYASIRQDTITDHVGRSIAIILISVPSFWLGTMIMIYPSIWWGWSPPVQYIPFVNDPIGNLRMLIIPSIVLGATLTGSSMRMTRTMMLEILRQDYMRTAWAKGLTERVIVIRHAVKNALIPVITIIGMQLPLIIGGSVIIEQIFDLPGMGRLMLAALQQRDYPLVQGINLVVSVFIIFVNLFVDMSYGWLDPRIHYQ